MQVFNKKYGRKQGGEQHPTGTSLEIFIYNHIKPLVSILQSLTLYQIMHFGAGRQLAFGECLLCPAGVIMLQIIVLI